MQKINKISQKHTYLRNDAIYLYHKVACCTVANTLQRISFFLANITVEMYWKIIFNKTIHEGEGVQVNLMLNS